MSGTIGLAPGGKSRRVYLLLRDSLTAGAHADGAALPGETRLAAEYGVSRATVRKVLAALEDEGLIKRDQTGAVRGHVAEAPLDADFTKLIPQLEQIGHETTARLLSFTYDIAPPHVAEQMAIDPSERCQTAIRVRYYKDRPMSYLTTYVPERIARNYTETDLASSPLYALLERSGVEVESAHQSVTATLARADVAEALSVATGAPLLSLRRIVRDREGRGVEYLQALYLPETFRLEMTLNRVGQGESREWRPVMGTSATE